MNKFVAYGGFGAALVLIGLVTFNGLHNADEDNKNDQNTLKTSMAALDASTKDLNELNACVANGNTLTNCAGAQDAAKNADLLKKMVDANNTPEAKAKQAEEERKGKEYHACLNATDMEKWKEVCAPILN